jgi:hypothetical protein
MRVSTTDPMTLNDVTDLDDAPFAVEGEGDNAVKIYFESEQNRADYLAVENHGAGDLSGLKDIFDAVADNPDTGCIN